MLINSKQKYVSQFLNLEENFALLMTSTITVKEMPKAYPNILEE